VSVCSATRTGQLPPISKKAALIVDDGPLRSTYFDLQRFAFFVAAEFAIAPDGFNFELLFVAFCRLGVLVFFRGSFQRGTLTVRSAKHVFKPSRWQFVRYAES
jgi:hypothetical protein